VLTLKLFFFEGGTTTLNKLNECFKFTITFIFNHCLISSWIELECGEAFDVDTFNLICSVVNLGDHNIGVRFKMISKLIPNGSQAFAVSTPRCIIFNKYVFSTVVSNLVVVFFRQEL